jgi:hypothetical protein
MQNEFLHNIQHVKIHGLSEIDIELHLGNDCDYREDYSNTIRDIFLEELDIDGHRIFHSIGRTMETNTTRALLSKQNEIVYSTILSDLDTWLCARFIDANYNVAFRSSAEVGIFNSTIDQRKTQNQVKLNAYASRIAKRFLSDNPNEDIEYFDTAPTLSLKRSTNLTHADASDATSMLIHHLDARLHMEIN